MLETGPNRRKMANIYQTSCIWPHLSYTSRGDLKSKGRQW